MKRASNDATLSEIGDIYKHYIALLECFKMNENEKILIEICGDVSKISKHDSFQMEVKHHVGNKAISDRDIDLWKSLRNWVKEFDRIKDLKQLILFTTANINEKSLFYNWNIKCINEKLNILKAIGSKVKSNEKIFRPLYDDVFNKDYCEETLKSILAKFEITSKQKKITNICADFNCYLKHIPKENRDIYIAALLGIIQSQVREKPHIWEITSDTFETILQKTNQRFAKEDTTPLPTEYIATIPPQDVEAQYGDKVFVKEIKRINHDKEIPAAINDYWRTYMTILKYYDNNPIVNKSLSVYKGDLADKLYHTKEPLKIDYQPADRTIQIKESQKLYHEVMGWDVRSFEKISHNQSFFQKGMIHSIVEGEIFTWDIGDEK